MTAAPPAVARSTWSARWAKSAERIEGARSIKTGSRVALGSKTVEILAREGYGQPSENELRSFAVKAQIVGAY
jgi:hypothetical protein